jgi:hypothetical protein
MALVIKNRSLRTRVVRDKRSIFDVPSPKHGGYKATKLLETLGIQQVDESFDAIMRVASEDEVEVALQSLIGLDARKEAGRESIISICGVVSGLTHGVEIVGE